MVPLFALVAQAHADTVVARIVPQPLTGFELSMVIIGGVAVLLPYLFFGATIWFAVRVHRGIVAARASLDELSRNVNALSESANRIAQDVAGVTTSVRADVDAVRETVSYANERARAAITRFADRVAAFNAPLETAQRETEGVVTTALTAFRGIREGVSGVGRKRRRPPPAEEDRAPCDDGAPDLPTRPRLRRRARGDS